MRGHFQKVAQCLTATKGYLELKFTRIKEYLKISRIKKKSLVF